MASYVQNILHNTIGDGARATKFECYIMFSNPALGPSVEEILYLTKTAQFPGKTHIPIDLKYKGRTIPIKGQVQYENTWTCTFYLTEDHKLKHDFEVWIEALDQVQNLSNSLPRDVKSTQAYHAANGYTVDLKIAQMDFHGYEQNVVYVLRNAFPKSVSAVEVDYSQVGTVLEFTVEFSFSHYDCYIERNSVGSFADEIKSTAQSLIDDTLGLIKNKINEIISTGISLVSNAIGNTVGGLIGGPIGNSIGRSVGSFVGQSLSSSLNVGSTGNSGKGNIKMFSTIFDV